MRDFSRSVFRRIRSFSKIFPFFWALFLVSASGAVLTEVGSLSSHRLQHVLTSHASEQVAIDSPCPICESFVAQTPIHEPFFDRAPFSVKVCAQATPNLPGIFTSPLWRARARAPPFA